MHRKRIISFIIIIVMGIGLYLTYSFYRVFFKPNTAFYNEESYLFIESESSFQAVLEELEDQLISVNDFKIAAQKKGYDFRIKGGKYTLKKGLNNHDIVNILRSKSTPVKVIFNNQERLENLAGRVAQQIAPDSLSLLNAFRDEKFLQSNGFNKKSALSMYLPNSYELFWNSSAEGFRERMLKEYKRFWNSERSEKAKALNLSPIEVISLAAIVQKETAKVDERKKIAGVYLNRLKKQMHLDADPTVIYSLKEKYQNFDTIIRRVLRKDLKIVSPYNTYKNKGIPPGPITMPDFSSIKAVLNPETHNYLYFVANPKQPGYHMFANTYIGHIRNSKIYYRWINSQRLYR